MSLPNPFNCSNCGESYYVHTTPATRGLGGGFVALKCPGKGRMSVFEIREKSKQEPEQKSLFGEGL